MESRSSKVRNQFTEQTLMRDAMAEDPNLPAVLTRFQIGGCSICGFQDEDTIAKVAEDNGIPVARLLAALNQHN